MEAAWLWTVWLLLAPRVEAAPVQVNYCFRWSTDYEDANTDVGDDFWISASPRPARGAQIRIREFQLGGIGPTVYNGNLPDTGPNEACTGAQAVDTDKSYLIQFLSSAQVNGNTVRVKETRDSPFVPTYITSHSPTRSGTTYVTYPVSPESSVLAAASYSQFRRPGGLSGETYTLYLDGCGGMCNGVPSTGSCVVNGDEVAIGSCHYSRKYDLLVETPSAGMAPRHSTGGMPRGAG